MFINEGAYLTFKSIFHKALKFILAQFWNHAQIQYWNQPVLSNKGTVSCSRKQLGPLMGLEPTTNTQHISQKLTDSKPLFTILQFLSLTSVFTFISFNDISFEYPVPIDIIL